jgi:hypothetical protein
LWSPDLGRHKACPYKGRVREKVRPFLPMGVPPAHGVLRATNGSAAIPPHVQCEIASVATLPRNDGVRGTFDAMTNEDEGCTRLSLGAKKEGKQMILRGTGGGSAGRWRGRGGDQPDMPSIRVWLSRSNPYDCEIEPTCRVSLSYICCDKRDPTPGHRLERTR